MTADQPQRPEPRHYDDEPKTEAGRALLYDWQVDELDLVSLVAEMRIRVLAIEAEARAAERTEGPTVELLNRALRLSGIVLDLPVDFGYAASGGSALRRALDRALAADPPAPEAGE